MVRYKIPARQGLNTAPSIYRLTISPNYLSAITPNNPFLPFFHMQVTDFATMNAPRNEENRH